MNTKEAEKLQKEIVREALPSVVFDGWTLDLIAQTAQIQGHDKAIVKALFPDGILSILDAYSRIADDEMMRALKDTNPENLRVRERIEVAVMARITWLAQHKDALKESINILGVPTRKGSAARMIWRTCDHIWQWAGDTSTDYNHYTKRGLLSGVLVATTLFWINDDQEDLGRTHNFLISRINNIAKIGRFISRFRRA